MELQISFFLLFSFAGKISHNNDNIYILSVLRIAFLCAKQDGIPLYPTENTIVPISCLAPSSITKKRAPKNRHSETHFLE